MDPGSLYPELWDESNLIVVLEKLSSMYCGYHESVLALRASGQCKSKWKMFARYIVI
jgi:hypothetical protein